MSQLEATFTPEVGSTVRVLLADGLRRERALVLTVGDNGDVEVLTTGPPETELVVPLESAEPLEPFEGAKQGPGCARADEDAVAFVERLKEEAKVLYGKKDFAAASQWYRTAIKALETHVSWRPTGSSSDTAGSKLVLVKVGGTLRAAEVLAVRSEDRALVSFLEASGNAASSDSKNGATAGILSHPNSGAGCDFDESDELEVVRGSDIVSTVCSSTELRAIACALRLNSARCELSLSRAVDKAIWDCAVVLRMAALPLPSSSSSSSSSSSPAWDHIATQATAHVLRGKAHLALVDDAKNGGLRGFKQGGGAGAGLVRAERDLAAADALRPGQKEVAALLKRVAARTKALLAADRRLAKDIGAWTERAMSRLEDGGAE